MKRTPMKRGKGFRMRDYQKAPSNQLLENFDELPSVPRELPKPLVRGVYGPAQLTAAPKTVEHRNEDLLRLARGRQCLFRLPGICNNDPATVVACHSNSQDHGKAGARKADDQWSAWGCYACHSWLDAGRADYRTKNRAFSEAHLRQQEEWAKIAYDMSERPKDRRAAEWALLLLNPPQ